MPYCFVPGCNSGYKSCKEKRRLFKVKQGNDEQLRQWKRLIPRADREFTFKNSVCDVHFDQRFIIKTFNHIINGQEVKIERARWRLTEDAKPTIFPNLPYYLTKKLPPQRTSPTKRKSMFDSTKRKLTDSYNPKVKENSVSLSEFSSSLSSHPPSLTTTVLDAEMIHFDNVAADLSSLKEKSSNTTMHNIETVNSKHDAKPHRKNKLYTSSMNIANLKQKIYTLRHSLKKTQTENKQLKAEISKMKSSLEEKHHLNEEWQSLPKKQQEIIQHFFRKFNSDPNDMRYDSEWILDCILLSIRLASGYEFLQTNNYLPLPAKTTLHRYINNLDADFGFDEKIFITLKMKLDQLPERERRGILIWDEIALHPHLEYNKHSRKFLGLADFGSLRYMDLQAVEGEHALVFLFQPHNNGWVQTLAAFCVKGATPGTRLAKLILQAIINMEKAGAIVSGTVCDGSTTNKSALHTLGISGDKNNLKMSFQNPVDTSRNVFTVIDVPHIIKCIRNNLRKAGVFMLPEGVVSMKHFEVLLKDL